MLIRGGNPAFVARAGFCRHQPEKVASMLLKAGITVVACSSCRSTGGVFGCMPTSWRDECQECHGRGLVLTGVPKED